MKQLLKNGYFMVALAFVVGVAVTTLILTQKDDGATQPTARVQPTTTAEPAAVPREVEGEVNEIDQALADLSDDDFLPDELNDEQVGL